MAKQGTRPGTGPASKDQATYTIQVAAYAICGLTKNGFPRQDLPARLRTEELAPAWQALFKENLHFDRERYQVELGGYQWRNPFNADDGTRAAFPKAAYYRIWRENPSGFLASPWFQELLDADFEQATGVRLPDGEHAPADFIEREDFYRGHGGDKGEAAGDGAPDNVSGPAPASGPATGRGPECEAGPAEVICDGLTVEAVRGVLADYPALADVIAAAAEVRAFPDGREKGVTFILANINRRIKKRSKETGELWGRADDKSGALSGGQAKEFQSLFEPWNRGGRHKKGPAEKPSS